MLHGKVWHGAVEGTTSSRTNKPPKAKPPKAKLTAPIALTKIDSSQISSRMRLPVVYTSYHKYIQESTQTPYNEGRDAVERFGRRNGWASVFKTKSSKLMTSGGENTR